MPAQSKITSAPLRIGILAIVALGLVGLLIFLFSGTTENLRSDATLYTYVGDSAAMAPKSQVRLNGILIGNIEKLSFSGDKDPKRAVVIEMRIRREYLQQIPDDSQTTITASNLLGDKFINITKGNSLTPVKEGGELKTLTVQDIPELTERARVMLKDLQVSVKKGDTLLDDVELGKGNIGKFTRGKELDRNLKAFKAEVENASTLATARKSAIDELAKEARRPRQRMDNLIAGVKSGHGSAGILNDKALRDDVQKIFTEGRLTVAEFNAGKGTMGKIFNDKAFDKQLNQTAAKLENTIDRINSGQGTLGQFAVNPQLNESLKSMTREAQSLARDIRANPKKFLSVRLAIF